MKIGRIVRKLSGAGVVADQTCRVYEQGKCQAADALDKIVYWRAMATCLEDRVRELEARLLEVSEE